MKRNQYGSLVWGNRLLNSNRPSNAYRIRYEILNVGKRLSCSFKFTLVQRRAQDAGPSGDGYNSGDEHAGQPIEGVQSLETIREREVRRDSCE